MPKSISLRFLIVVLGLMLLQASARAGMLDDMVQFDQAYLPALILTRVDDGRAMVAMERLFDAWARFKQQHAYASGPDVELDFDLNEIEWHILEARRLLRQHEPEHAYQMLQPVQDIFIEIRQRHQYDYYLDEFSPYQHLLSALQHHDIKNTAIFRDSYTELLGMWLGIVERDINPYAYGLNMQRYNRFIELRNEHLQQLIAMDASVLEGNREKLEQQLDKLEAGFYEILACFGRFPDT